jgi:hypothetical protein
MMPTDDDLLYHYTSAAGLIGLLGTPTSAATMWLTQIQYMNDEAEFYHAYELARGEIIRLRTECPNVRRVIAGMWGIPHDIHGTLEPVRETILHRYFTFSLSEEPDLLSQWRGYAPDGGYSVGFKVGDLKKLAAAHRFQFQRCIYDDNEKKGEIATKMREIEAAFQQGEADYTIGSISSMPEGQQAEGTARARVQMAVNRVSSYFKHQSFQEEREWRIVGMVGATDGGARWRARGNSIIPYCELNIGPGGPESIAPIEVIIGPGVDYHLAKYSIEMMKFENLGKLQIRPSASTLRR